MFAAVDGVLRAFFMSPRARLLVCLFVCVGLRPEETSQQFVTFPPLVLGGKKTRLPEGRCAARVTSPLGSHSASTEGKKSLRNTLLCFE